MDTLQTKLRVLRAEGAHVRIVAARSMVRML